MPTNDALELVEPYLESLGRGFHAGVAPDGTPVLSTPFRFCNGDPLEIAVWEQGGEVFLSDRGGLVNSLLLSGIDALEASIHRARLAEALTPHAACLRGGTVIRCAGQGVQGQDVQSLIQSVIDAQTAGHIASARREPGLEPVTYGVVRQALESGGARYRENMTVSGALGRRYPVDFQLAFETEGVSRAILIVATTDRTLELAERWNFRFRDIRAARGRLHRLFLVEEDTPWTTDAQRTIDQECEQVFPPGEAERLEEYVRTARPLVA